MTSIQALAACAVLSLMGCDAGQPTVGTPTTNANVNTNNLTNSMEFRGRRNCVDCDGIESWLRLEQAGKARRYLMVEVYYGQPHERRFDDEGSWSTQGELLRLRSSNGGERVYSRSESGYLQARGARGQRLPAVEDDVLEPASFDRTQ